jgi:hypothetical protein
VITAPATPSAPTTTRAAVINAYGEADQLVPADVPLPAPTQTQVLVDVAARQGPRRADPAAGRDRPAARADRVAAARRGTGRRS